MESLEAATVAGRGGLPAGLAPRDGLEVCRDLLAAAAVFGATVAMLDAGLGRESRSPSPALHIVTVYHGHWNGEKKNVAEPPEQSTENKMREGLLSCVPPWLQSAH